MSNHSYRKMAFVLAGLAEELTPVGSAKAKNLLEPKTKDKAQC